jgi:hypothetical protein
MLWLSAKLLLGLITLEGELLLKGELFLRGDEALSPLFPRLLFPKALALFPV